MELLTPGTGLIFWQTLTFLAIVLILGRFAWRPIISALKAREDSIEDALKAADLAMEEMKLLQADNEKLLQEARKERDEIVREAQNAGNRIRSEAKEVAESASSRILDDARKEIIQQKEKALSELKGLVANLSVEIAEKVLRRELNDKRKQEEFVNQLLKESKLN
jgi:F-type H+-transporting ATPase subunit b